MPPPLPGNSHKRHESQTLSRTSIMPTSGVSANTNAAASAMSITKSRQYAHLHSQLAQLNAHLADTENLVRMTAVQAGDMRFLGGYIGGMFMGAAKVLGEEGVKASNNASNEGNENGNETAIKDE
ncbi:DASH complex subunit Hsk3 like-domain-containing protein [Talaromyces proteolyticus]|uniref:DASH complex subunit Hsk3 like-domain-containing protein n=1 Tax=Talaromyces proteolyticus TaxID=1131652 RepID=A0AAD4L2W2_9EURO|nr:DASH complex subunit Hsk3 like-domain-containing protein [Talaromyces proteolyticus]KAH8705600.1 DASH complex subunit Hsk3 like-domain-containing protein [Talaromyces proteolyticus]